ncbi:MAG: hypothetical protein ACYDH9_17850 [Limisphaerales bacterium]
MLAIAMGKGSTASDARNRGGSIHGVEKIHETVRRGDQAATLKQASPAVQPAPDNKADFL